MVLDRNLTSMDSLSKLQETQSKTRELVSSIIKYVTEQQQIAYLQNRQDEDQQRLIENMRTSDRGFWTIAQLQTKRMTERQIYAERLRKQNDAIAELKRENLALHALVNTHLRKERHKQDRKDENDEVQFENEAQGKSTRTKIDRESVQIKNEESSPMKDEKNGDIEHIQAEKETVKNVKRKQQKEQRKMTQKIENLHNETKKLIQGNQHFKRKLERTKKKLKLAKSKLQEEEGLKNEMLMIAIERKRLIDKMQKELENLHLQKNQRNEAKHPNVFRRWLAWF